MLFHYDSLSIKKICRALKQKLLHKVCNVKTEKASLFNEINQFRKTIWYPSSCTYFKHHNPTVILPML